MALAAMFVALFAWVGAADAGGRKRIVVLDFDGPKAEKFHDDVVRLIKKSHTVVSTDKWNGAAEQLDASTVTEKNVKKVAKKLKIDGIVTGKIEKRRDEYIVQLKLRAGTSGELAGNRIDTKADGPRLEGKALRDVKDELVGAIEELEANHGGGGDEDDADAKPGKKKKVADDDGDEEKPAKHGAFSKKKGMDDDDADAKPGKKTKKTDDDDAKPGKKAKKTDDDDADAKPGKKTKKTDDDDADAKPGKKIKKTDDDADAKPSKKTKKTDDDDAAALATKKTDDDGDAKSNKHKDDDDDDHAAKKKKVAKGGDDDDNASAAASSDEPAVMSAAEALSPANRGVDFTIGLSFTARSLSFTSDPGLPNPPPSYKQSIPVAGGIMDAIVYPMAITHKATGPITGLGIEIMYDKVIKINSQKNYIDTATMTQQTANLATVEDRFAIGAVFRYPVTPAILAGAKLQYSSQQFNVVQTLPNGSSTDIPDVHYSMAEPKLFLKYSATPAIIINVEAGFMLVTSTGGIQQTGMNGYGPATVSGYEGSVGLDYGLTKNIFLRAALKYESVGLTFKGDAGSESNTRDNDPTTQDVHSAKDVYFGGMGTIGYAY